MPVSRNKSYWWSPAERLAENSYFRQRAQGWQAVARPPEPPATPAATSKPDGKTTTVRATYKVYWTKGQAAENAPPAPKDQWSLSEYHSLDEALGWARQVNRMLGVTWLISCPTGPTMTKVEIEEILRKREAALTLRPRRGSSR